MSQSIRKRKNYASEKAIDVLFVFAFAFPSSGAADGGPRLVGCAKTNTNLSSLIPSKTFIVLNNQRVLEIKCGASN